MEEKILIGTKQLLMQYGIRSITMDDIARHLGMSKKTIYQYYADKDELLLKIIDTLTLHNASCVEKITTNAKDAVAESLEIMSFMANTLNHINPTFFYDLQRYYPECWNRFSEFKQTVILKSIMKSLNRGIEEGFFRDDFNVEIIARLRLMQIPNWMDTATFNNMQITMVELMENTTLHYLYGISTPKGYKLINKYRSGDKCPLFNSLLKF